MDDTTSNRPRLSPAAVTTALDVVGLLAVALGCGMWLEGLPYGRGVALAGFVLLAGSWRAARRMAPGWRPAGDRLAAGGRRVASWWRGRREVHRVNRMDRREARRIDRRLREIAAEERAALLDVDRPGR